MKPTHHQLATTHLHLVNLIGKLILLVFTVTNLVWFTASRFQTRVLGTHTDISPSRIIELTNHQRLKRGLPALTPHTLLNQAAYQKAQHMIQTGNFDHYYDYQNQQINPWTFITDAGYEYLYAGENLARHFFSSNQLIDAWMDSPEHQDNLLNQHYTHIGVAIIEGPFQDHSQTNLIVQLFATPLPPGVVAVDSSSPSSHYSLTPPLQGKPPPPTISYPPQLVAFATASTVVIFGLILYSLLIHQILARSHPPKTPHSKLWYH